MTETVPDPLDAVLRSDHAAILRGLAELRTVEPSGAGEHFAQLTADIVRHFVAEEQYLLPTVRERLDNGHKISDLEFAEHESIEKILRELDNEEDADDKQVEGTVSALQHAMAEHARRQEQELLPQVVAKVDQATLAELGEGALGAEQLAPTHPRAFVPKSATVSKVTSWLEGLVEKSLDSRDKD
jgi:hemerythrin